MAASLRLSNADRPTRDKDFTQACEQTASNQASVIRGLVDAWLAYIKRHGHAPSFPVEVIMPASNELLRAAEDPPVYKTQKSSR